MDIWSIFQLVDCWLLLVGLKIFSLWFCISAINSLFIFSRLFQNLKEISILVSWNYLDFLHNQIHEHDQSSILLRYKTLFYIQINFYLVFLQTVVEHVKQGADYRLGQTYARGHAGHVVHAATVFLQELRVTKKCAPAMLAWPPTVANASALKSWDAELEQITPLINKLKSDLYVKQMSFTNDVFLFLLSNN